ncbi:hypothetical protein COCNU_11G008310 [Cocos nucifera]|uniref:Uncharacterized protein n=1 Tax=Cocos nucifera TaxID=13894 RepID=A0A8K0IR31_COCNU|nr:hypothetical protein COCNU_11G008310 [Cocos nucifera]
MAVNGRDVPEIVVHDGGRGAAVTVQVLLAGDDARRIGLLAPELRPEGSGGGAPGPAEGLHGAAVAAGGRPLRRWLALARVGGVGKGGGGGDGEFHCISESDFISGKKEGKY